MSERFPTRREVLKGLIEEDVRPAFVIRSHHLFLYEKMMHYTPEQLDIILARNLGFLDLKKTHPDYLRIDPEAGRKYHSDMLKDNTPTERAHYINSHKRLFTLFNTLPDDYPIEIVEGQKDLICKTCPLVGEHCSFRNQESFGGETLDIDIDSLTYFIERVPNNQFLVKKEDVEFCDAPPEQLRRVCTTKKTVRTYLTEFRGFLVPYIH